VTWWGWIIVGAQFYLVIVGSAAILTGLATLAVPLAEWLQWALFAVLAIVSMVTFRDRLYHRFIHTMPKVATGPAGGVITLPVSLGAGESCQAEYGGTFWTVCNDSDTAIPSGSRARIARVQDLTLLVRPEK
jgi:membrane protein implicated in regulation of membrane protease activity